MPACATSTSTISSVAYAVEEIASEAKIGRATRLRSRWWPSSDVAIGRPIRIRLASDTIRRDDHAVTGAPLRLPTTYTPPPCTSSSSAAVGSARRSARVLTADGHTVAIIDRRAEAFARLGADFAGTTVAGHRLRPRPPHRGRHRGGRRARRGDERRQLQHPRRPGRPGELRHRARRRPHLRPAARGDLPAPRDHDRGDRRVDDRPGACAGCIPEATPAEWTDPTAKVCLIDRSARRRLGRPPARRGRGGDRRPRRGDQPHGRGDVPTARTVAQAGDVLYIAVEAARHGRRRRRAARAAEEGALTCAWSSPGRQRRPVHRRAAARRRSRGDDHRQRQGASSARPVAPASPSA